MVADRWMDGQMNQHQMLGYVKSFTEFITTLFQPFSSTDSKFVCLLCVSTLSTLFPRTHWFVYHTFQAQSFMTGPNMLMKYSRFFSFISHLWKLDNLENEACFHKQEVPCFILWCSCSSAMEFNLCRSPADICGVYYRWLESHLICSRSSAVKYPSARLVTFNPFPWGWILPFALLDSSLWSSLRCYVTPRSFYHRVFVPHVSPHPHNSAVLRTSPKIPSYFLLVQEMPASVLSCPYMAIFMTGPSSMGSCSPWSITATAAMRCLLRAKCPAAELSGSISSQ